MRHPHHHHHCGPRGADEFREAFMGGRRGRGRGGPGGLGGPSGFGGPGGFGGRGGYGPRRPRARRGQIRAAILVLLGEEPRNGYGLIQEIEQRSEGAWRPSPGSVYPALALMEDEGLIRSTGSEDQRSYELTDAGREALAERGDDAADPWEDATRAVGDDALQAMHLLRQVGMALRQVAEVGTPDQVSQAKDILTDARRSLYGILAEEPTPQTGDGDAGDER